MPVSENIAGKIEGNRKTAVQLQLALDTFTLQKLFLVDEETYAVYAEMEYKNAEL
jgi:hypothetical protein